MATKLPDLPRVTLRGPFWTAEAELIQLAQPAESWAFRTLFLDPDFFRLGKDNVRPPGTLLVLCWVRSVTLHPADGAQYVWRRASAAKPPPRPAQDDVLGQVSQGGLALLVVQPDPSLWVRKDKDNPGGKPAFAPLRVLAGDISLDPLVPQGGAREKVYAACGLEPAEPGADRTGAARLLGKMTVHAGGVSLFGAAALPWELEGVRAPFLLAQHLPLGQLGPPFRLQVEEERLTEVERAAIVAAWGRLEAAVNPGRPRRGEASPAPAWVTLEVASPDRLPRMHWEMEAWDEKGLLLTLRFARGEFTVLLADQQPYAEGAGPTSLARIVPDSPSITRSGLSLVVEAELGTAAADGGTLTYAAEDEDESGWEEAFTLSGAPLAFSAVEAPRQVRDAQALPVPEWVPPRLGEVPDADDAVDPPVVWGMAPLADGWAQLPVPNLTEQMYLDAGLARAPSPDDPLRRAAVLQGAVSFGNDRPGAPEVRAAEQPWSLTLTNAGGVRGTWTLGEVVGGGYGLRRVELQVHAPELVLNGLFWLSTEAPTLADALPGLDDWVAGLRPVSLNTVRPGAEIFPPVVVTPVESLTFFLRRTSPGTEPFPTAALGEWTIGYDADEDVFGELVDRGVLPPDTFSRHLPLVWRRHAALPMVQALPLTQSLQPPTHPARSRQLVPFELGVTPGARPRPDGWRFGVDEAAAGEGAARWPRLLGAAAAAGAWRTGADLPLVSLSLPGLVLDPRADPAVTGAGVDGGLGLPLQYRWDLPYTDEPNALAQLPRTPAPPATTPPRAGAEPRPQPLTRETLAAHWRRLSERASLAAVDAATAFRREGDALVVRNLVEPLPWPAAAAAELDAYPGTLTLRNAQDPPAPLALSGDGALRGVRGRWAEAGGALRRLEDGETAAVAYEVEAGSMAAARAADGAFRDQRGLFRGPTSVGAALLRTPVRFHESAGYLLVSSLAPFTLHTAADGDEGEGWALWFRDLPAQDGVFRREDVLSQAGLDVNDPHAGDREHNALNGWEWRLGVNGEGYAELFGLHFYPVALERVGFDGEAPARVELTGRLQLPLIGGGELPDFTNAVRLAFVRDPASGRLVLDAAAPADAGAVAEWPLALRAGEGVEAPRLEWSGVAFDRAADALRVSGGRLRFFLYGAEWVVPLADLAFIRGGAPIDQTYAVEGGTPGAGMEPRTLRLRIDLQGRAHDVSLLLAVRLGKEAAGPGATEAAGPAASAKTGAVGGVKAKGKKRWRLVGAEAESAAPIPAASAEGAPVLERAVFDAEVRLHLLEAGSAPADAEPGEARAEWVTGRLFDDMELPERWMMADNRRLTSGGLALQFAWDHAGEPGTVPPLQLLPGMHVGSNDVPGFAALSFTVREDGDVPSLALATAFVEATLHCRWGAFLQEPPLEGEDPLRRVFGSSAGDLAFGYTGEQVAGAWTENVLLNGFVEVKDLVSWPAALSRGADGKLSLPAARGAEPLAHVRHTLRILFNQHTVPSAVLRTGEGGLLFDLRDGTSWQFLAVTEHQLVNVTPSAALDAATLAHDRRWTAVQEVRLARPSFFKRFLLSLVEEKALDPVDGVDTVGGSSAGWTGAGMRTRLAQGTTAELDRLHPTTLVVEASAVHWISQRPVDTPSATTLQYLPRATQLAVPSRPEDFGPSDPRDPQWLLLATPFLGRLQDEARDGLRDPAPAPALQVDPILALGRARAASPGAALPDVPLALAGWGDAAPVRIAVSGLDTARGRLWARLDPLALEESWFRLQNPFEERPPERLPSVLASFPATAARLGRAMALTRAFQAQRLAYPPARPDAPPVPADLTEELVWRPDRLFVIQGVSDRNAGTTPAYGWFLTGLQLLTSALWAADGDGYGEPRTHPAATLLPTEPQLDGAPLPLAVSPFLGLDLRPALGRFDARLVYAELLCLNGGTGALLPVASMAWELKGGLTRQTVAELAQGWARETHGRLAPDSPVAVLRFREVNQRTDPAAVDDEAVLTTTYRFDVVRELARPAPLARRVFRVRSDVTRLRFRDGRFGGRVIPGEVKAFELAPPQTVGVQPLHLAARPDAETAGAWPWGMSALRVSVRYTADALPAIGPSGEAAPAGDVTLWWQAPQHRVQYRSPARGEGPTAGLPPFFRAPAIRGLLPVVPDAPLPAVDARGRVGTGPALERWQPVLPGALRYLLLGARAGAMLSLRHQLLRQSGLSFDPVEALKKPAGEGMTSGSVPAQHRVPRPVPLPVNDPAAPETALRTWASRGDPGTSVRTTPSPADEGWFAAAGGVEARRIRFTLRTPGFGAIGAGWDGTLLFDAAFGSVDDGIGRWSVALEAADGEAVYGWEPPLDAGSGTVRFALRDTGLLARVAAKRPGETLTVRARVAPDTAVPGFSQTLSFVLRVAEGTAVPLPLEPRFFHFEDPEYDRRLASAAAHASGMVQTVDTPADAPARTLMRTVTLATDRKMYNPDGVVSLRWDWEDDQPRGRARITPFRIDTAGVPVALEPVAQEVVPGSLVQLALSALRYRGQPARLNPGDVLRLELCVLEGGSDVSRVSKEAAVYLSLDIVAEPVQPVPEAAYALLKRDGGVVECPRFAWAPEPARVELVNPADLRAQVVRRRAVFHWTDTVRRASAPTYGIQKISATGSTHTLQFETLEVVGF
jgi:hypothetical protein